MTFVEWQHRHAETGRHATGRSVLDIARDLLPYMPCSFWHGEVATHARPDDAPMHPALEYALGGGR